MSNVATSQDFIDAIAKDAGKTPPAVENKAPNPNRELRQWEVILHQNVPDSVMRERVSKMFVSAGVFKDVMTPDLGAVRIPSLYPVIHQIQNTETKFLNILNQKPVYKMTDTTVKIVEENIGTDSLAPFNVEGDLPAVKQSNLTERTNTLTCLGQKLQLSWLAEEIAAQSPYKRQEYQIQLQKALLRIFRSKNALLLNSVEQTSEILPMVPQLGGFCNRSTNAPQAITGNLTDVYLANAVNNIAAYFGYDLTDLVILTNSTQIAVIRNLMINRYPGTDPVTYAQKNAEVLAKAKSVGVPFQMVYEDNNVIQVGVIREMQLPAGTTLIYRADYPQLAGFQFDGQFGPFMAERPITNLYRLEVVFDLFSLVDPLVVTRQLITGHN